MPLVTSNVVNLPAAGVVVPIAGGVSIDVINGVLISVASKPLKVGAAAAPDTGPANIKLGDCVARAAVNVPEPITGLFDTVKILGIAKPTDVTEPPPVPQIAGKPGP